MEKIKYTTEDLLDRDFVAENQKLIHPLDLHETSFYRNTKRGIKIKTKIEIYTEILQNYRNLINGEVKEVENFDKIINHLVENFCGNQNGLILIGRPGSGKTTIMKAFKKFMDDNFHVNITYVPQRMIKHLHDAKYCWDNGRIIPNDPNMIVDDFGTEPNFISEFGNRKNPFIDLVLRFYDMRSFKRGIFWATTNLSFDEVETRYGSRVLDRLGELCKFIDVGDNNFRM